MRITFIIKTIQKNVKCRSKYLLRETGLKTKMFIMNSLNMMSIQDD